MKTKIVVALLALIPTAALCATLHVPADFPTIGAAVAASSAGDEVVIAPATYNEHGLVIDHALVVRSAVTGERAVIDAQEAGPVMTVDVGGTDAQVSILDIGVVNGTYGVVVESQASLDVTMERCLISGNVGNGILVLSARSFTVVDSEVSDNGDSGIFVVGSNFACTDSRIVANTTAEMGGGVALIGSTVEMANVEFDGNSAAEAGGGISIHAEGTYLLDNCTFANCSAPMAAQAYFHDMDGYTVDATFNCCEVDTSQFGGPAWESGSVAITHEGCDVAGEAVNWGTLKTMFK